MKRIILHLFAFLILIPTIAIGQQDILAEESHKFCEIYLQTKSNDIAERSASIIDILDKYNVSATRYKEIINRQLLAQEDQLSPNELALIKEIEQKTKQLELYKKDLIAQKCQEYALSKEKYMHMLLRYKTDIEFQRSMKPFMDKLIQEK